MMSKWADPNTHPSTHSKSVPIIISSYRNHRPITIPAHKENISLIFHSSTYHILLSAQCRVVLLLARTCISAKFWSPPHLGELPRNSSMMIACVYRYEYCWLSTMSSGNGDIGHAPCVTHSNLGYTLHMPIMPYMVTASMLGQNCKST